MKKILEKYELQQMVLNTINKVCDITKTTLGPYGKTVILQRVSGTPYTTKDGVSVVKSIQFEDPAMNIVTQLIKDVANRVVSETGDGTTTSMVLTQSLYQNGLKLINENTNISDVKIGIETAVDYVIAYLEKNKKIIKEIGSDDLYNVGFISSNGDDVVASMIVDAINEAGKDGVIIITENDTHETVLESTQGLQIEAGYMDEELLNDDEIEVDWDNSFVFVYSDKLVEIQKFTYIFEAAIKLSEKVIIFAPDYSNEFMRLLKYNKKNAGLNIIPIKVPYRGDVQQGLLEDIALITGTQVYSQVNILQKQSDHKVLLDLLGKVKKINIRKNITTFVDVETPGLEDKLLARVSKLDRMIAITEDALMKEYMLKRKSRLTGGLVNIKVGAISSVELFEKKDRIEDALNSVKSAIDEGVVVGGGTAYLKCVPILEKIKTSNDDINIGIQIVINAIKEPFKTILINGDLDYKESMYKVINNKKFNYGFNMKTKKFGDLYEEGVIDPLKVLKSTLKNSASTASMLLMCSGMVCNDQTKLTDMM